MEKYIKKSDSVDIMLFAEGTYPYVKGGVSSWIHQLITGLPHYKFGIVFIGSKREDYKEISYKLPNNLTHLEVHYLFEENPKDNEKNFYSSKKLTKGDKRAFNKLEKLYEWFRYEKGEIPLGLRNIEFFTEELNEKDFLHSKEAWNFIERRYQENCPDIAFVDYFWTIRNIHKPIWQLSNIVKTLPKIGVLHSPSTGYAGFLGALVSYDRNIPFVLTEHGIYIRERKIDMLTASWIEYQKPSLIQQYEEFNYIKQIWVNFFEKIGKFAYSKASPIISLFNSARRIQASFGADINKTISIPNGVDVEDLKECIDKREEEIPKVVTLIGRVVPIKDIKTFIRAIKTASNYLPDIEGWIVGPTDEDRDYAEECSDMVETMDLKRNIKFLGFQNIKEILPKTGVLTLTSISEGMPLVILEGMASGVPCVTTDVGCCRELLFGGLNREDIEIGQAGFVTHIAKPNELAKAYLTILMNERVFKKFQRNGIERVNRFYTKREFLKTYDKIYRERMDNKWQE